MSTEAIVTYLPWVLSCITIWMTLLAGNHHRYAWAVGLVGDAFFDAAWDAVADGRAEP